MNKIEKFVYDILKHNPKLKLAIRNQYQRIFDLLPTPLPVSAYEISARQGYFFGFHDHTPFSGDNKKLLAHRYNIPLRIPQLGENIEIGYFDGDNFQEFHPITFSKAWSWHLGAKLQWRGSSNQVVFNDHENDKNISRIVDIETKEDIRMPEEIGSVSPDGQWAVGYSFSRVEKCMPGYGYPYTVNDPEKDVAIPERHGIHRINLDNRDTQLLFSISDIAKMEPNQNMQGAYHFFSHIVFSPDSKRFIFLHRWIVNSVYNRYSRMVSSDINGKDIYIFPTINMVSHIGWQDDNHVIAYSRVPKYDDQYVVFQDQAKEIYQIIGEDVFNSDGHPSFDPTKRWIVTDTYPDRRRIQNLIVYDTKEEKRYDIAKLPMPKCFQSKTPFAHWTCDLHPRWDREGRYICFDSTYTGTRSLCTIDLGSDLNKNTIEYLNIQNSRNKPDRAEKNQ